MSDLIDRKGAIDALEELKTQYFDRKVIIGKTQDVINNLPSAQPERKTGKWICSDDLFETAICSCCKWDSGDLFRYVVNSFGFCPNCGSDMRGENNVDNK